jgi:C-methyltransferase
MTELSAPADTVEPMLRMLNGHCLQQALYVAAVLGLADLLFAGPMDAGGLATEVKADPDSLRRLLRTLASVGVFEEGPDSRFSLNPLGATLRSDAPNSVRDRAIYCGSPAMWDVWGDLLHSVRTGESACEHVHGVSFYDHLLSSPEIGETFNRFMARTSQQHADALIQAYDFGGIKTLVDVGGGLGGTLTAILAAFPGLRGVVFDLPTVADAAITKIAAAGLERRCQAEGGDMRRAVPRGEAYLLKWVLMDRSDEQAVEVLRNCAEAMTDGGRVLAVEMTMPPDNRPSFARVMDVQMMLLFGGGRIRTAEELRGVFAAAGLEVVRVLSAPPSPNAVIEGRRSSGHLKQSRV